jgi:phosphatidylinositol alpha-1,6-mannosyltransferase
VAKTLLVTNDFGPRAGGIESFVIGLLERLPFGEVIVYTSTQENTGNYDLNWLERHGVKVIRDKSRILLPTPRVVRRLRRLIESEDIERIWFGAAAPLGIAARWLRVGRVNRLITLTHGHEVWWAKVPPFSFLIRFAFRHIDVITYLGSFTRNALVRVAPQAKLFRIAPGIDLTNFVPRDATELRRKLGITDRPTIVSVGRLVHRKGQDRLIEALPKIKQKFPDTALVFVGEGPHRSHLEKLVRKYGLLDDVFFIGRVPYQDLAQYISVGDIFAMPSRSRLFGLEVEGLGIVYLEASATELPVIAGDSGGAPDAIIEGETGFVVDGKSPELIAERAIQLLENPELRKRLGKRGRDWVMSEWRWEIWSERFNELLMK